MMLAQHVEPMSPLPASAPVGFQVVALTFLGLLLFLTIMAAVFRKATRGEAVFWSLVWVAAGVAIVRYDWTMVVARSLGIGRGADLMLYGAVGVMLVGFMMVYIRLRRLRREITLIVRHLALQEAPKDTNSTETGM